MSQLLILSDSHFLRKNDLQKFINSINPKATIHCGDIYLGYQDGDIDNLYICKGNNDFADIERILHFTIDDVTFTIIHGHTNNFSVHPETLKTLLLDYPSDVICFGHSHVPYFYQDDDVMIINPGSLTLSRRYPRINTYALFDTEKKTVTFYNAQTHKVLSI